MTAIRPTRSLTGVLVAALALVAPGCDDDDGSRLVGPGDVAYTTPAEALAGLVSAYRYKDIGLYDALTHDEFLFRATDADPDVDFTALGPSDDHATTAAMFAQVISIDVSLEHGGDVPSDVEGYEGPEFRMIDVPQAYLSVETRIDGDLWTLKVEGDPVRFVFEEDTSTSPSTYTIVYEEDLRTEGRASPTGTTATATAATAAATAETSWSELKRLFLDVDYLEPVSPTNVLLNLVAAYEAREIEPYDAVTHPEFVFKASESDPDVTFDRLGALQDRESTENMFNQVVSIEIDLGDEFGVAPSDVVDYQGDEYSRVFAPRVFIRVTTRVDGEDWTISIDGDPAKFIFKRDGSVSPPTYSVIFQQDLHQGGLPRRTDEPTWASLKGLYL